MIRGTLLALAAVLLPAASPDRKIRFGLTGDYPPFAQLRPDGSYDGADIVAAQAVARSLGAKAEFVPTTWQTLAGDFAAGRFDVAIGGLTVTPERAQLGTYSITLMDDGKRPLARCRDRRAYRTIAAIDRPGVHVQINRGPLIATLAKDWFHQATVQVNSDDTTLTDALLAGRADVWVTDGVVVDLMTRRYPGQLCATTNRPFTHQVKAWLIRSDPALVRGVNAGLERSLRTGAWRRAVEAQR